MNKRMRFVVSALFVAILLLVVAITRFYSETGGSTGNGNSQTDIVKRLDGDILGNKIFQDSSGLYGIIDSSERIIVAPEWLSLSFTGKNLCIASKMLDGNLLTGCIDYEGNVVVPMIYSDISRRSYGGFVYYCATPAADNSCVIYDENFSPIFSHSWESAVFGSDEMTLKNENGTYQYSIGSSGFTLIGAELSGSALDCDFNLNIYSQSLLSKFTPDMLEQICRTSEKYIEFAITGNGEAISDVRTDGKPVFTTLFPEDKNIISKRLTSIPNVFLYSVKSDDAAPHYAVSITAGVVITYTDENGKKKTFKDNYKAIIEFSGSSLNDLTAVSGSFLLSQPNYPKTESETDNDDFAPENQSDLQYSEPF
ncbi:MAG: WG repeat-containing protein [Ruminococcus flavefaciens]|nr:WG repeat-containing protein [Ruminococcus flavefaciens]MCM1361908.1 WG repeat-containing protein [Clostridiales bacterium]MCM1434476.1 WG repeat-containing protein [Ruminococcus flavefaciens]